MVFEPQNMLWGDSMPNNPSKGERQESIELYFFNKFLCISYFSTNLNASKDENLNYLRGSDLQWPDDLRTLMALSLQYPKSPTFDMLLVPIFHVSTYLGSRGPKTPRFLSSKVPISGLEVL